MRNLKLRLIGSTRILICLSSMLLLSTQASASWVSGDSYELSLMNPMNRRYLVGAIESNYKSSKSASLQLWNLRLKALERGLSDPIFFEVNREGEILEQLLIEKASTGMRNLAGYVALGDVPLDLRVKSTIRLSLLCRIPVARAECLRLHDFLYSISKEQPMNFDFAQLMRNINSPLFGDSANFKLREDEPSSMIVHNGKLMQQRPLLAAQSNKN